MDEELNEEDCERLFTSATGYVRGAAGNLKPEDLLYLYSRYKQVHDGPCNTSRPGMFDFQGKQKWDAWKKLGDMTKQEAMSQYIEKLCAVQPDWELQLETGVVKSRTGMGVGVSTLGGGEERELGEGEKTSYDWCKEGNVERVERMLAEQQQQQQQQQQQDSKVIDRLDDTGLALLHWACDRGLEEMVRRLVELGADPHVKDAEGQTPLHYAVTCEHADIISYLVSHGVNVNIEENDGSTPSDCTDNVDIKKLLQPKS